MSIFQKTPSKLYHGGFISHKSEFKNIIGCKGRWEYGPGLYLTSNLQTARDYSKGPRRTFLFEIELTGKTTELQIDYDSCVEFINTTVPLKHRSELLEFISKRHDQNQLFAYIMLNLIDSEILPKARTKKFREFFISQGIQYTAHNAFNGILVTLFDPTIIKAIKTL